MTRTLTPVSPGSIQITPSLDSILAFWRQQSLGSGPQAEMARLLVPQIDAHPELSGPLDSTVLGALAPLVEALVSCVVPAALQRFSFAALASPSPFDIHWATPRFRQELLDERGQFCGRPYLQGMTWDDLRRLFQY